MKRTLLGLVLGAFLSLGTSLPLEGSQELYVLRGEDLKNLIEADIDVEDLLQINHENLKFADDPNGKKDLERKRKTMNEILKELVGAGQYALIGVQEGRSRRKRDIFKKLDKLTPNMLRWIAVPTSIVNYLGFLPIRIPGLPYHKDPGSPDYRPYVPVHNIPFDGVYHHHHHNEIPLHDYYGRRSFVIRAR